MNEAVTLAAAVFAGLAATFTGIATIRRERTGGRVQNLAELQAVIDELRTELVRCRGEATDLRREIAESRSEATMLRRILGEGREGRDGR